MPFRFGFGFGIKKAPSKSTPASSRILSKVMDVLEQKVRAPKAVKLEFAALVEDARGVMYSAMNDINFIAGEHVAHYTPFVLTGAARGSVFQIDALSPARLANLKVGDFTRLLGGGYEGGSFDTTRLENWPWIAASKFVDLVHLRMARSQNQSGPFFLKDFGAA